MLLVAMENIIVVEGGLKPIRHAHKYFIIAPKLMRNPEVRI